MKVDPTKLTKEERQAEFVRNAAESHERHLAEGARLLKEDGWQIVKLRSWGTKERNGQGGFVESADVYEILEER